MQARIEGHAARLYGAQAARWLIRTTTGRGRGFRRWLLRSAAGVTAMALAVSTLHVLPATAASANLAESEWTATYYGQGCDAGVPPASAAPRQVCWVASTTRAWGAFQVGSSSFAGTLSSSFTAGSPSENVAGGSGTLSGWVQGVDLVSGMWLDGNFSGTYTRSATKFDARVAATVTLTTGGTSTTGTLDLHMHGTWGVEETLTSTTAGWNVNTARMELVWDATTSSVYDGSPVPAAVVVTPAQAKSPGQSVTVTATVRDQNGQPMPDRVVTFDRKGANPGTSTATTDTSGNASVGYTGIASGADVVTASTPSVAGVTVSGVGGVLWAAPPPAPSTAVEFVPPAVHAPSGNALLSFRATNADGSPFSGTVRYAVGPLGSPGAFTGTATATDGQGVIPVTTTASEVQVDAFADRSSEGSAGSKDPEEAAGTAIVTTRAVPRGTTVVFAPPFGTAMAGSDVPLSFVATYTDGALFTGNVRWCAASIPWTSTTFCQSSGTATAGPDGRGTLTVTPTADMPTRQVNAYADAFTLGTQDSTEATGAAVVIGTTPPPPVTTTTTSLPPVTTTSTSLPPVTTTSTSVPVTTTSLPPVTTTSVPVTTTSVPVTTTSTSLPPVTTTSTSVPTTTTTLPPNTTPLVPSLVSPSAEHEFGTTDAQLFTIHAVDPDGDAWTGTVQVTNGSGTTTSFTTAPAASGADSEGAPTTPLPQGSYTWRARATDADGANSPWSTTRSFTVANQAPIVPTLVSPAPAKALSNDDPQLFTVASGDAEGDPYTATITIRTSGGSLVTSFTTPPALSGEHAQGLPTPPLPVGDYTWSARATDAKGAAGPESDRRAFSVVLNRPPGLPVQVTPRAGERWNWEDPQVFSVAAEDPNGDVYTTTVVVKDDLGITVDTFKTAPAGSGASSSGVPTVPLGDGDYTWVATATDATGLSGPPSPARAFTVHSGVDLPPDAMPADIPTTRASEGLLGAQAADRSEHPVLSDDGRFVAFESEASNLVSGDTNGRRDIFVHDRVTGLTERVSVSDTEAEASASGWFDSFGPSISSDGRYVAFVSSATNLVTGDTNDRQDVFVRDREAGTTTRVNLNGSGTQADGSTYEADLSSNGRYVVFSSDATNVVSGDTNGETDVFFRDIQTGFVERVSVKFGSFAQSTTGPARNPTVSDDGRYVAFESDADDLMGGGNPDNNFATDVFVHDRNASWGTSLASNDSTYLNANGYSRNPRMVGSGGDVVFESTASNLVGSSGDTNGTWDVYRYDLSWSSTERVSLTSSGTQLNGASFDPGVSAFGGYVAFRSSATNALAVDRNGVDDVLLRDVGRGITTLVSHDPDGHQANNASSTPSVSADGMHVAFGSLASNLVRDDTNGGPDIFAYNRRMSLTCMAGALSAVGCLSGYGYKASSDRTGLEEFYSYHAFDLGSDTAYLNAATGNLVVQGTDMDIPGRGLNMRLTHTYNSQKDQGEGPLGRGWRIGVADGESEDLLGSVVSAVLSADVGQILEVVVTEDQFDFFDADGTRHHFVKGGFDGPGWHAPPGVDLTLTDFLVGAERRYKATRPDGVTYTFRPTTGTASGYYVDSISDRNGNQLSFAYSGGRLASITDASGRAITFAWSGDYLSSATYAGTTVTYSVNASTGRLTSISAGGRTVNYGYDSAGLRTVTDGRGHATTFSLSGGMLTQVTDRAGKAWTISYNTSSCQPGDPDAAVATCVTDPEGRSEVYTSSAAGNLLTHRDAGDPAPNQRSWLWDANRLMSATDEGGSTTDYAYNDNGQVVLTRQSGYGEELTTALTYRDVAPGVADLIQATVGAGSSQPRTWKFGRSETGNLTSVTDPPADPTPGPDGVVPDGAVTRFAHDGFGRLTSVTDPRGKTTTYGSYHASGQPGTVTDPLGKTKSFSYDDFGRVTSVLDRNGQSWGTGYDARGNATSQSSPVGTATFAYDANDNRTSATPPGGATVTRVYDNRDLLIESSATVGGTLRKSTYGYYDDGQLKEVNEPRSFAGSPTLTQKVQLQRFPNDRVSAAVDETGAITEFTYTPEGRVRTVLAPPGATGARHLTTYTYNRRGQAISVLESGHEQATTNVYDVHGALTSTKTPGGATTTFVHDGTGRLVRTVDAQGRSSTRTYDPAGNLVTLTQPEGQGGRLTTTYSYTARNEIATESDPADGGHVVEYAYDDEGRQRFRYDRHNGTLKRTVEQTYRSDGAMLTRIATGTGLPTHASTFGYDTAGNMTSATATLGGATVSSLSVSYNGAFEPTAWTETVHDTTGTARTKTGSYAYQPDGRLASRTVDDRLTTYAFDAAGRETGVTPWDGLGSFANEYFPNGLLRKTSMPNEAVVDQLFDAADRLVSRIVHKPDLAMTQLSAWTGIAYDEDDRRVHEVVTQARFPDDLEPVLTGNAEYSYDSLGRLVSAKHPFEAEPTQYTLDDGGNVLQDADTAYTYAKNRLDRRVGTETEEELDSFDTTTTAVSSDYTYDDLGNQRQEHTVATATSNVEDDTGEFQTRTDTKTVDRTYTYDGASHPNRVDSSDGSWVAYAYDALGRLARRVEHPTSGADVVTLFFHDGGGEQIALETDGAGTAQVRYVLDSGGDPVAQDKGGARSYYVDDPRGNLTQQLDGSRNVVAVYGYDPYGGEKKALTRSASASWESRLRFQMAPRDPATGTYNLGPRLFDPGVNRFVGADSYVGAAANMGLAADPLTGNRYLYAGANPAGLIDDGHAPWDWAAKQGKRLWRAGKSLLKNPWVRIAVATVICFGSGIGCFVVAGAVLAGANYLANSPARSLAGFTKAVVGEAATAAAGAVAGQAAAQAAAALFRATATRIAQAVATSRAGDAAGRAVGVLRHYTDDAGRAGIQNSGTIKPSLSDGRLYVTPSQYTSGAQAQAELALSRTPTGYFEIPASRLSGLQGPGRVGPSNGQPGGGLECWVTCAVDAGGLKWNPIGP